MMKAIKVCKKRILKIFIFNSVFFFNYNFGGKGKSFDHHKQESRGKKIENEVIRLLQDSLRKITIKITDEISKRKNSFNSSEIINNMKELEDAQYNYNEHIDPEIIQKAMQIQTIELQKIQEILAENDVDQLQKKIIEKKGETSNKLLVTRLEQKKSTIEKQQEIPLFSQDNILKSSQDNIFNDYVSNIITTCNLEDINFNEIITACSQLKQFTVPKIQYNIDECTQFVNRKIQKLIKDQEKVQKTIIHKKEKEMEKKKQEEEDLEFAQQLNRDQKTTCLRSKVRKADQEQILQLISEDNEDSTQYQINDLLISLQKTAGQTTLSNQEKQKRKSTNTMQPVSSRNISKKNKIIIMTIITSVFIVGLITFILFIIKRNKKNQDEKNYTDYNE